jgi:hypothetical protein
MSVEPSQEEIESSLRKMYGELKILLERIDARNEKQRIQLELEQIKKEKALLQKEKRELDESMQEAMQLLQKEREKLDKEREELHELQRSMGVTVPSLEPRKELAKRLMELKKKSIKEERPGELKPIFFVKEEKPVEKAEPALKQEPRKDSVSSPRDVSSKENALEKTSPTPIPLKVTEPPSNVEASTSPSSSTIGPTVAGSFRSPPLLTNSI